MPGDEVFVLSDEVTVSWTGPAVPPTVTPEPTSTPTPSPTPTPTATPSPTPTATPTATPAPVPQISDIKSDISLAYMGAGQSLVLPLRIYGVNGVRDDTLGDDVTFDWSVSPAAGGTFAELNPDADADLSLIHI